MNLIKTSLYSTLATTIRIIASFVVNKMVALFVGPSGLALLGNFQNFISIFSGLSTGAINSGVVKYTAEYAGEPSRLKSLFSTSLKIIGFCSLVTGIVSIVGSRFFSVRILHQDGYSYLFVFFGIAVFFFALNAITLTILNGRKEIRKYTLANILSSILSLGITVLLIYFQNIKGALLSLVLSQSCIFFISLYYLLKCDWFSLQMLSGRLDRSVANKLFRYSLMGITSAIVVPVSLLLIRNYIATEATAEIAGYWEAVNRISSLYLMAVTTSLAIYYLPRLSETHNTLEIRKEISKGFKFIMPIVFLSSSTIYFLRYLIIKLLFTHQFNGMEPFFLFQLIGDNIKIASWLFAFLMLAKALARLYIITEIIFSTSYVLLSMVFISHFGAVGATYAYSVNYTFYLITCFFLLKRRMGW